MLRQLLPQRRGSETFTVTHQGRSFTVTVGLYPDDKVGEVFIDGGKTGQDIQSIAGDAAVVISLALQHRVAVETFAHAVTRDSAGEPASIIGAVVDCISAKSVLSNGGRS
jgi:ribonucleoside-diphosphate reductase alpha chain